MTEPKTIDIAPGDRAYPMRDDGSVIRQQVVTFVDGADDVPVSDENDRSWTVRYCGEDLLVFKPRFQMAFDLIDDLDSVIRS